MSEADTMERIGLRVDEDAILDSAVIQRRGPVGVDWARIAEEAEAALVGVAASDRGPAIELIAKEKQISGGYLRRALSVLPLLDDPYFSSVDLRKLALQAVDVVRRWATYDKPAALEAAAELAARTISVPTLVDREKEARGDSKERPTSNIDRLRDLRQTVQAWAKTQHDKPFRFVSSNSKLDSIFRIEEQANGVHLSTGYMVAGPFSSASVERNRMKRIILQALGMIMLNDKVVLVCASDEGKTFVHDYLKQYNVSVEDLRVVSITETLAH